jgi:hypothetical protein
VHEPVPPQAAPAHPLPAPLRNCAFIVLRLRGASLAPRAPTVTLPSARTRAQTRREARRAIDDRGHKMGSDVGRQRRMLARKAFERTRRHRRDAPAKRGPRTVSLPVSPSVSPPVGTRRRPARSPGSWAGGGPLPLPRGSRRRAALTPLRTRLPVGALGRMRTPRWQRRDVPPRPALAGATKFRSRCGALFMISKRHKYTWPQV